MVPPLHRPLRRRHSRARHRRRPRAHDDEILDRHLHGTRYGICADPNDGLLRQGDDGLWLFAGFIALINDEFYVVGQEYIFQFATSCGAGSTSVVLAAGVGLFSGAVWARIVGVLMASLAMLIALAWLTWYPIWVLLLVAVSVAVIWALTAHGRDAATPASHIGSHAGRVVLTGVAGG